jgi:hypothetical protein
LRQISPGDFTNFIEACGLSGLWLARFPDKPKRFAVVFLKSQSRWRQLDQERGRVEAGQGKGLMRQIPGQADAVHGRVLEVPKPVAVT